MTGRGGNSGFTITLAEDAGIAAAKFCRLPILTIKLLVRAVAIILWRT
jgi:hypothetical protein